MHNCTICHNYENIIWLLISIINYIEKIFIVCWSINIIFQKYKKYNFDKNYLDICENIKT